MNANTATRVRTAQGLSLLLAWGGLAALVSFAPVSSSASDTQSMPRTRAIVASDTCTTWHPGCPYARLR